MQILDECHHCIKDAPYNHIMQIYKKLSEEDQAKTQVICHWKSQQTTLFRVIFSSFRMELHGGRHMNYIQRAAS